MKNVLVITLNSHEGDFMKCVEVIHAQRGVSIEHHIISDRSEIDAHVMLVKTWNALKHRFDGMVKVDADTVITKDDAIATVFDIMERNDASSAQVRLHDYYTNSMINGLNFFTQGSTFEEPSDVLFCDRCVTHKKLVHSDQGLFPEHSPIGVHCFYSTQKQAYHFGVHRGLKNRHEEMELVRRAMADDGDTIDSVRAFVIAGYEDREKFRQGGFNYIDYLFKSEFMKAHKLLEDKRKKI